MVEVWAAGLAKIKLKTKRQVWVAAGAGCSPPAQRGSPSTGVFLQWITVTKLGRLVRDMKIKSLEIYLFSLSIKESEIVGFFLGASLKDEGLKNILVRCRLGPPSGPGSKLL